MLAQLLPSAHPMEVFLYMDGDGIGQQLEAHVVNNNLQAASRLSRQVTEALQATSDALKARGATIVFCGGDNLLAATQLDEEFFDHLIHEFEQRAGCTASAGIGRTATEAYLGLTVAKSLGGGRTIFWKGARGGKKTMREVNRKMRRLAAGPCARLRDARTPTWTPVPAPLGCSERRRHQPPANLPEKATTQPASTR